jgi:hypothetical protein
MAATQKPLAFGVVSGTSQVTIYTDPAGVQVHPFLVITNNTTAITEATVVVNNNAMDLEIVKKKIPGGVGKAWRVLEVSDVRLASGYSVKIQLSGGSVNYFLSGVEFDNT